MKFILDENYHSILDYVKDFCKSFITKNDIVVDMTIGNGNDTLFLSSLAKFVYGFDIQKDALANTTNLLKKYNITNYKLFLESHENINVVLKDYKNKISLILFNLGYLPGGDKSIITNKKSTLNALKKSIKILKENGKILIACYPHEEGVLESNAIKSYLETNNIAYQEFHNTKNEHAPFLIII